LAALENAAANGVEVLFGHEVTGITERKDEIFDVQTTGKRISCRYIVNAAGLFADTVAGMVGDYSFSIHPRKGEYLLLDKNYGNMISQVIFQAPSDISKGVLVTPTAEGNLLLGPTADDIDDKNDFSTSLQGLGYVMEKASISVPGIKNSIAITSFAGSRAISSTNDFIISRSSSSERLVNAAGIGSPGLTAAPAVALYIIDILKQAGLCLEPDNSFDPLRKTFSRMADMDTGELDEAIKKDHRYAKVVCRCESVSEAEIVAALKSPLGSGTLDGIKRRTRAGMGRCQGGFCTPRVMEIISRELSIPMEKISKSGKGSEILSGRTK
jgi:glycerol-3-phosphate dehydrogenase